MSKYWVAIEYNIDDDHYVKPLGIFSEKKYAIAKIMERINKTGFEIDSEDGSNSGSEVTAEKLLKRLTRTGECDHVFGYMIKSFEIEGKIKHKKK